MVPHYLVEGMLSSYGGMLALKRGLYSYEGALTEEESFAVLRGALPEWGGRFAVRIFSPCPYIVTLGLNVIVSY